MYQEGIFILKSSIWFKKCKQTSQTNFNEANYSAACWYVYIADSASADTLKLIFCMLQWV